MRCLSSGDSAVKGVTVGAKQHVCVHGSTRYPPCGACHATTGRWYMVVGVWYLPCMGHDHHPVPLYEGMAMYTLYTQVLVIGCVWGVYRIPPYRGYLGMAHIGGGTGIHG